MNGAATANRRLRFLGFARNDFGALGITSGAAEMTSRTAQWGGFMEWRAASQESC